MKIAVLDDYQLDAGRVFLDVAAVRDGLAELCQRFDLELKQDRDDLDVFRFVYVQVGDDVVMIQNYPRNHPDGIYLLFPSGLPDVRARAERVVAGLGLSSRVWAFDDSGYATYPG